MLLTRSKKEDFTYLDRGFKEAMVLIPGWATNERVFKNLDLDYNYILAKSSSVQGFNLRLANFLAGNLRPKVSLFGSSLGGFLAVDFVAKNPSLVKELVLVGVRRKYPQEILALAREQLIKNKAAFLSMFYQQCFSSNEAEELLDFKKNLMPGFIKEMKTADLCLGLDYLGLREINLKTLTEIPKIRIFHGEIDSIAPVSEAREIVAGLPQVYFQEIKGSGHLPFLSRNFRSTFYNE